MEIATHAIGDRGITEVLDAYAKVYGDDCRRHQPRIEHVQVTNPELVARFAEMGVIACVQPSFPTTDAATAKLALGERYAQAYDWTALLDAGVEVIGGSDFPIETQNPLLGLQRLATGADVDGEVVAPFLAVERAFDVMTNADAGSMTLSADPTAVDAAEIHALSVISVDPAL